MTDTVSRRGAGPRRHHPDRRLAATPSAVQQAAGFYRDKARRDVDAAIENFLVEPFSYIDATLGTEFPTREVLRGLLSQGLPTWPEGANSYMTRVLGDENSAIVYFTNDAGIFFPADMRSVSAVNFVDGKIARWIDYWDANHIGAANLEGWRHPQEEFPADFGESKVGGGRHGADPEDRGDPGHGPRPRTTCRALRRCSRRTRPSLTCPATCGSPGRATSCRSAPRHRARCPYLGHGVRVRHALGRRPRRRLRVDCERHREARHHRHQARRQRQDH